MAWSIVAVWSEATPRLSESLRYFMPALASMATSAAATTAARACPRRCVRLAFLL
jgi:hypothetical protein